ncbi:MAG TPA: YbgF trimerization domain-containing protein [Myxococcota bacterium]
MRALIVVAAIALCGCVTTREEGETLKRDMAQLKSDVAEVQRQNSDLKTQQKQKLDDMQKRVTDLEGTLQNLRQSDADVGVQLDKVVAEVQALRGEVEQAKHDLGETTASVASILARPPLPVQMGASAPHIDDDPKKPVTIGGVEIPAEAKPHYDAAKKLYDEKKYAEAADAFDLFLHRHTADSPDLTDNAAYWKAESYFNLAATQSDEKLKQKSLKQAILAYQPVIENVKSEKAEGALYKAGLAFEQLGDKDSAAVFFDELITKHPKSSLVGEAKRHLKAVGGAKKKR